uniref:Protein kinase domain-containing protein n=1 Tax=Panagrolaimus sp. JU765 TaxID=591449 RepID=A0AC34R7V9_9BILA
MDSSKTETDCSKTLSFSSLVSVSNVEYTLERIIGRGGYGTVYSCFDPQMMFFALKAQRPTAAQLESRILKLAEKRKCKHFARLIDEGWSDAMQKSFLVMDMLGPSLSEVKSLCPNKKFSAGTGIRVAMQTLNSIEELHSCGYISRDVKPSNFVTPPRPAKQTLIYMIDFGIAKNYIVLETGNLVEEKPKAGFRGTARYCSIRNHFKQDQGRKDDVESWFYACCEFFNGKLPWTNLSKTRKSEILDRKMAIRKTIKTEVLQNLPKVFEYFLTQIDSWKFETKPIYQEFYSLLDLEMKNRNLNYSDDYDWQTLPIFASPTSSPSRRTNTTTLQTSINDVVTTQASSAEK